MNFSLLQSFLAVAKHGSFTGAARYLFITQPAISQHIQTLEEELGVRLFVRQGKGVLLTEEGRELEKSAEDMLRAMNETKAGIQERSELKRGELKIAITEVLTYLIPPAIIAFHKKYPGIKLQVFSHRAATVLKMVAAGQVSCGIAHKPSIVPAGLSCTEVHEEALVLAAPVGHHLLKAQIVTPQSLKNETMILRENGTLNRNLAASWFGGNHPPNNFIEANSMSSMRELVRAGSIAFLPQCVVKRDLEDGRLIALNIAKSHSNMAYKYYLYTRTGDQLGKASRAFLELLSSSGILSSGKNIAEAAL